MQFDAEEVRDGNVTVYISGAESAVKNAYDAVRAHMAKVSRDRRRGRLNLNPKP